MTKELKITHEDVEYTVLYDHFNEDLVLSRKWSISHGYVVSHNGRLHRLIAKVGKSKQHVHHLNGNKLDNRVDNLMVLSPTEHLGYHKAHTTEETKQKMKKSHRDRKSKRYKELCEFIWG